MQVTPSDPTTNGAIRRRHIVAGGLSVTAGAAAGGPDAQLIAWSEEWLRLDTTIGPQIQKESREWEAAGCPKGGEDESGSNAIGVLQSNLMIRIVNQPAHTLAGCKAKARVQLRWMAADFEPAPVGGDEALTWSLVNDLAEV